MEQLNLYYFSANSFCDVPRKNMRGQVPQEIFWKPIICYGCLNVEKFNTEKSIQIWNIYKKDANATAKECMKFKFSNHSTYKKHSTYESVQATQICQTQKNIHPKKSVQPTKNTQSLKSIQPMKPIKV